MGLEQKKFFESGIAAERARILEELERNIFDWEFELESEQWRQLRYTYYSSKDIFAIVKGETKMSEYTPTTEQVKSYYRGWLSDVHGIDVGGDQFDRWLKQHDAEVRAAERERNIKVLLGIRSSWSSRRLGQLHGKDGHESSLAEACRFAVLALDEVSEILEGETK